MVDPTIRVANLGDFKKFITDLGSPPEGLTVAHLHAPVLTVPGTDGQFKELEYLNKSVEYQSQQVSLFVQDVIHGYAGAVEMVNFIGGNYYNAEMYSGQKLRKPMSKAEADAAYVDEIGQDDGLPHDAHGWTIYGPSQLQELDTRDTYQEQHELGGHVAPPKPKQTDWPWKDAGSAFRHVHKVFEMMEPSRLAERADRWATLAKALRTAGRDLQQPTTTLASAWKGPAANAFRERMYQAISSVHHWSQRVEARADNLKDTVRIMNVYKQLIDEHKVEFERIAQKYKDERWALLGNAGDYRDLLYDYDRFALMLGRLLAGYLSTTATGWSAPPRYPGFTSDTPLPAPTAGPVGAPPGPGGGPPGAAGGPPGGGPMPGNNKNAQKIVDGIRNKYEEAMKKQQKEYERALRAQQDAAAEMKKQYEDALAKEREAATKQAEDLQKGLRDAQQGLPPGLDAGPQGLDDALRQQQELLDSLGTPPQSIEDLTRDLGRAMENVGLDPSAVSALPAYLNGLGGLGGLGGSAAGLPAASNSPDLLGRGGTTPAATTGLGASALTGRMMPGATPGAGMGMGGMPMMPPMGGMPMGGGGAAPLSGRKNRPPLPGEETQKPASRPRIVDPAGDGNTETRPARAGDRRAVVAQPTKAPEAEPGQALGRTA